MTIAWGELDRLRRPAQAASAAPPAPASSSSPASATPRPGTTPSWSPAPCSRAARSPPRRAPRRGETIGSMSMDLGLDGRGRAGDGREPRDRPGDRGGAGPRRRQGRDRQPLAGADRGGGGGDRRRRRRPSSPTPPTSTGSPRSRPRSPRRSGRSRSSSPTPAGRRSAAPSTTSSRSGSGPTARSSWRRVTLAGAVVPGMRERGWGRIVNVGSTSTREPIPGLNLSNAHRMAAIGFLKTLSLEVAGDGITVNTVATGRFATERLADADGSLDGAEEAARTQVPGRPARAARRSTATSSPSSAPSAPPTSPAPRSRSTAASSARPSRERPMAHSHHGHTHGVSADADRGRLWIALALILGLMAGEVAAGYPRQLAGAALRRRPHAHRRGRDRPLAPRPPARRPARRRAR